VVRLAVNGPKASVVALAGVTLPFILGFVVSFYLFSFEILPSLFIASTFTATSIGISLRVLRDLKQQNQKAAEIIIGAAVLDDIFGIIMLATLYEFSMRNTPNLFSGLKILAFICIFFLLSPLATKVVSFLVRKWGEKKHIPGLLPTTLVSLILIFAWIAQTIGASKLLGGFAAGLAMSRHFFFPFAAFLNEAPEFSQKIEEQINPIVHLFAPIFFVSIGLSLNLKPIAWNSPLIWSLTLSLLFVAIAGKLFSGFFLFKESMENKWIIGTAMIPRGEVGLIFANIALMTNILTNDIYAAIIVVIALTTVLSPIALNIVLKWKEKHNPS